MKNFKIENINDVDRIMLTDREFVIKLIRAVHNYTDDIHVFDTVVEEYTLLYDKLQEKEKQIEEMEKEHEDYMIKYSEYNKEIAIKLVNIYQTGLITINKEQLTKSGVINCYKQYLDELNSI